MPPLVVKQVKAWQNNVYPNPTLLPGTPSLRSEQPIVLNISIQFDGHGYLLLVQELDGSYSLGCWHPSLANAESSAQEQFGITPQDWEWVAVG